MTIKISDLQKLNPYEVETHFKIKSEQLPKYFHIKHINNPLSVKLYRIKHWIFHHVWINEKKLRQLKSSDFPQTFSPAKNQENPSKVKKSPYVTKLYGGQQLGLIPNFQKFTTKPITVPPAPIFSEIYTKQAPREKPTINLAIDEAQARQILLQTRLTSSNLSDMLILAIVLKEVDFAKKIINQPSINLNFVYGQHTPLALAIATNQPEIAKLLINHGASPSFCSSNMPPPIEVAVIFNHPDIVRLLVDEDALLSKRLVQKAVEHQNHAVLKLLLSLNVQTSPEFLYMALLFDDKESLELLLQNGCNSNDAIEKNPLYAFALAAPNPELIDLMIKHGLQYKDAKGKLDKNFKSILCNYVSPEVLGYLLDKKIIRPKFSTVKLKGIYNFFHLYKREKHLNVFHEKGVNPLSYTDWFQQKLLTHRFDLEASVICGNKSKSLNGFSHVITIPEMYRSLSEFFAKNSLSECPELTESSRQDILDAFKRYDNALPGKTYLLKSNLQAYHAGKLTLLPAGDNEHVYYRVFYKGVMGESNRGRYFEMATPPGLQFYKISSPSENDFIQSNTMSSSEQDDQANRLKTHQNLNTQGIMCFKYKPHKAGICSWAGLKTAVRSMFFLKILEEFQKKMGIEEAVANAEKMTDQIYKKWSAWDKENALAEALQFYVSHKEIQPNKALLKQISQKFKGSTPVKQLLKSLL